MQHAHLEKQGYIGLFRTIYVAKRIHKGNYGSIEDIQEFRESFGMVLQFQNSLSLT